MLIIIVQKVCADESYFHSNYASYILRKRTKCTSAFEKFKTSYHIAWLHSDSVNDDQPSTSSSKASSMGWTKTISFFLHFLFTALFSHLVHPLKKSPKQKWECGKYFSNSICSDSINHTSIITSNTKRNLPFFLLFTELIDKCIGSRIHIVMKSDKEIVGVLLGFDDYVSILVVCRYNWVTSISRLVEKKVSFTACPLAESHPKTLFWWEELTIIDYLVTPWVSYKKT